MLKQLSHALKIALLILTIAIQPLAYSSALADGDRVNASNFSFLGPVFGLRHPTITPIDVRARPHPIYLDFLSRRLPPLPVGEGRVRGFMGLRPGWAKKISETPNLDAFALADGDTHHNGFVY